MPDLRMPDLNHLTISGRLTRDVELKYTSGNLAIARGALAHNTWQKDKEDKVLFLDFVLFREPAERCAEWAKKGQPVIVEGRLSQNDWTDNEGQKRTKIELLANRVLPLTWPEGQERPAARTQAPAAQARQATLPEREPPEPYPEDDIPF